MNAASTLVQFSGSTPQAAAEEVSVGRVRLFDTRAWIAYRPDEPERVRRDSSGMASIVELDVLDALMDLPAGIPVPLGSLRAADRRLLRRAPAGALDWAGDMVTRRVVPPLMPLMAMVRAGEWMTGLEAASRFAAYCRRLMIVSKLPVHADLALAEASFYGVGVAVVRGSTPERDVGTRAFRRLAADAGLVVLHGENPPAGASHRPVSEIRSSRDQAGAGQGGARVSPGDVPLVRRGPLRGELSRGWPVRSLATLAVSPIARAGPEA